MLELADAAAIKISVKAGTGVTIIPAISVHEEIEAGMFTDRRLLDDHLTMRFDAIYRRGGWPSKTSAERHCPMDRLCVSRECGIYFNKS